MSNITRFFAYACLAIGLVLSAGCEYSSSSESSSSSYISIDDSGEVATESSSKSSHSDSLVNFVVDDITMRKGETEFETRFINKSSKDVTITGLTLSFKITDKKKKTIWSDNGEFKKLNIVVPAKGETAHVFAVENVEAPAYDDDFHIDVDFSFNTK